MLQPEAASFYLLIIVDFSIQRVDVVRRKINSLLQIRSVIFYTTTLT